jgi:hypothetical protein
LIVDKKAGNAVPQVLGRIAHDGGRISGLLVWSRLRKREKNLVLFPDRLGLDYELHDPDDDLSSIHPTIMDAMRTLVAKLDASDAARGPVRLSAGRRSAEWSEARSLLGARDQ